MQRIGRIGAAGRGGAAAEVVTGGDGTMEPELTKMKTAETQSRGTRLADEKSKNENGRLGRDRWPLLLFI